MSGLLNLAIIALKQLINDNGFVHIEDVHSIQREYNQNSSTIDKFLINKCHKDTIDRDNYAICRDVYQNYIIHCKNDNKTPVADNVFGCYLAANGIKKERRMLNKNREYCYIGVSLSSNNDTIA